MTNQRMSIPLEQLIIAIAVIGLLFIIGLYLNSALMFVLVPFLIFIIPLGFSYPYLVCSIFFILSVFRLHEVVAVLHPFHLPLVFGVLSIISVGFNVQLGRLKMYWCKEMTYFLRFSLWVSLGVLLAYDFDLAYKAWTNVYIKLFIIFYIIIWSINSEKACRLLVKLILMSGVILSMVTLYKYHQGKALAEAARATLGGISAISDPNDLALVLLFSFSISCSMFLNSSSSFMFRLAGLLGSVVIVAAVMATQSRGGLIGLAGVIAYFATHQVKNKVKIIFITVLSMGLIYVVVTSLLSRFSNETQQAVLEASTMGRIYAWKAALNMVLHHPIFGVGLNGFQANYYNYAIEGGPKQIAAHSSWFQVLAETGFPGLMLFILCVFSALKVSYQNIQIIVKDSQQLFVDREIYIILARGLFAGLISYSITSTFLSQGFTWPFYSFFALTIALSHVIKTKIHDSINTNKKI